MDNSCLMLAMAFHTSVELSSILEESDLTGYGIEKDPHITILYAEGKRIEKESILPSVNRILGDDYRVFLEVLKDDYKFNVTDLFNLSVFEDGDSDYLILRLKENNELFKSLYNINKGLSEEHNVESKFNTYKPHLTIAKMIPGTARKYLDNRKLQLALSDSKIAFEDLVISYDNEESKDNDKVWSVTTFHTIDRLFREKLD